MYPRDSNQSSLGKAIVVVNLFTINGAKKAQTMKYEILLEIEISDTYCIPTVLYSTYIIQHLYGLAEPPPGLFVQ